MLRLEQEILVLVGAVLASLGLAATIGLTMRRRGHDLSPGRSSPWRSGRSATPAAVATCMAKRAVTTPSRRDGTLDVLVADDGSDDALFEAARAVLASSPTSWTFATVLDVEAATTSRGHDIERATRARRAKRAKDAEAELGAPAATVVLHGEPAGALNEYARVNDYELIVAGSRAHALSRSSLGSVARWLASGSAVPVLLGPSTTAQRTAEAPLITAGQARPDTRTGGVAMTVDEGCRAAMTGRELVAATPNASIDTVELVLIVRAT